MRAFIVERGNTRCEIAATYSYLFLVGMTLVMNN